MSTSFFGRAWKLTITPQTGEQIVLSNSNWDAETLKVTFQIDSPALQSYWFADIAIYNSKAALSAVLQQGDLITLEAGYQSPGSGLIFHGPLFQPLWEREGDVDYKLTLHCLVGLFEDRSGDVGVAIGSSFNDDQAVRAVAAAANPPISIEYLDPSLATKTYPRGRSYSGPAAKFFADIASDLNLQTWMSWNGLNIRSLEPQSDTPDVIYAPPGSTTSGTGTIGGLTKYTLIGTPQQTELGVSFRTLLDPDAQLGSLAKIAAVLPARIAQQPNSLAGRFYDPSGLYVIAGVRHIGDSRGGPWYTEVTGLVRNWDQILKARYVHG